MRLNWVRVCHKSWEGFEARLGLEPQWGLRRGLELRLRLRLGDGLGLGLRLGVGSGPGFITPLGKRARRQMTFRAADPDEAVEGEGQGCAGGSGGGGGGGGVRYIHTCSASGFSLTLTPTLDSNPAT